MISNIVDIKRIRKSFGLTQAELAKLAGVSQSLIAKLESNMIDPSFNKVKKISDVLEGLNKESELKAADIMTKKIISCRVDDVVAKVIEKMRRYNISQLPVFDGGNVAGMVSEKTILESVSESKKDVRKMRVGEVVDEPPPIVANNTPSKIVSHLLKHFPLVIVTSKGKYVGVVTKSDILKVVSRVD